MTTVGIKEKLFSPSSAANGDARLKEIWDLHFKLQSFEDLLIKFG